jgi:hypothetical protein
VHIGLHKTGSSWLQRDVFRYEGGPLGMVRRGRVEKKVIRPGDFDFDPDDAIAALAVELDAIRATGRVPVVSHEGLSGNPHSGGYDRLRLAQRLHQVVPHARVLMVVREQHAVVVSAYKQYVREGGPCSARQYLEPPKRGAIRVPLFDFRFYDYDRLIDAYQGIFGRDRVLVLTFEQLVADADEFVRSLGAFMGMPDIAHADGPQANPSLPAFGVALKRRLNRFLVRDGLNPSAPVSIPRMNGALDRGVAALSRRVPARTLRVWEDRLRDYVASKTAGRYGASNSRTAALTGLDLRSLGYDMPVGG